MAKTILPLFLVFIACVCGLNLHNTILFAERTLDPASRWSAIRPADPYDIISFKILLKLRNTDKLDCIFWEVNDPQHPNYGRFLSTSEVDALIAPEPASVNNVLQWVLDSVPTDSIVVFPSFIQVTTTVSSASRLFSTSFYWYESKRSLHRVIRIYGTATIPMDLTYDVDFVIGISELFDNPTGHVKHSTRAAEDNPVIPSLLKSYYQIPVTAATNKKNLQAVAEFGTFFSFGALAAFDKFIGETSPNITRQGTNCFPDCDQTEPDVDVQYITAMGSGVPTIFMGFDEGSWILDWALATNALKTPPLVNSISYGWAELDQCEMADNCAKLGYNSMQYINRTDTEFQALGVKGVSVIVADGDDGAPSLAAASGNCPMDHTKYCPTGGCTHTTSDCTEIIVTFLANNTECFFPMGLGNDICAQMVDDTNWNIAMQEWITTNSECRIALESDAQYEPHIYSACSCDELKTVNSSGYKIGAYVFNQTKGAVFSANYPTSSPYVTSVGATQFVWDNDTIKGEISASILNGAYITSGGGFSSIISQPTYQTTVVANYLKASAENLPPSFAYNPKMRGYPDVAFNGHNFVMFESINSANLDICPCQQYLADGTECSSPSFAGMISLINDKLLNSGKTSLGFLNPLLYQMSTAKPSAFRDITSGSNKCNRVYCCIYGYTASAGWDPVTGLGTPAYTDFEAYILTIKNVTIN